MNLKAILSNSTEITSIKAKLLDQIQTLHVNFPKGENLLNNAEYKKRLSAMVSRLTVLNFAEYANANYTGDDLDLIIDFAVNAFNTRTADTLSTDVPYCDFFWLADFSASSVCKSVLRTAEITRKEEEELKAQQARIAQGGCYKCGGTGRINAFRHVEGGVCYACDGKGERTRRQRAA